MSDKTTKTKPAVSELFNLAEEKFQEADEAYQKAREVYIFERLYYITACMRKALESLDDEKRQRVAFALSSIVESVNNENLVINRRHLSEFARFLVIGYGA